MSFITASSSTNNIFASCLGMKDQSTHNVGYQNAYRAQLNSEFVGAIYFLISVALVNLCLLVGAVSAYFFPVSLKLLALYSTSSFAANSRKRRKISRYLAQVQNNVFIYCFVLLILLFLVLFVSPIGGAFGLFVGVCFLLGILMLVIFPYWLVRKFLCPIDFDTMKEEFSLRNQLIKNVVPASITNEVEQDKNKNTSETTKLPPANDNNSLEEEMKEVNEEKVETNNYGDINLNNNASNESPHLRTENDDDDHDEDRDDDSPKYLLSRSSKIFGKNKKNKDSQQNEFAFSQKVTKISWNAFPRQISLPHGRMILVFIFLTCLPSILVGIIVATWNVAPYRVCAIYYNYDESTTTTKAPTTFSFGIEAEVYTSQTTARSVQLLFQFPSVLKLLRLSSNWFEIVKIPGSANQQECFYKKFANEKYAENGEDLTMTLIGDHTYSLSENNNGPFQISSLSKYSSRLDFHLRDFKFGKRNLVRPLLITAANVGPVETLYLSSVGDSRVRIFHDLLFVTTTQQQQRRMIDDVERKKIDYFDGSDVTEYSEFLSQRRIYRELLTEKIIYPNREVFSAGFLEYFFQTQQSSNETSQNYSNAIILNVPAIVNRFSQQDTKLLFSPISGQVVKIFDLTSSTSTSKVSLSFPIIYDILPENVVMNSENFEELLEQYFHINSTPKINRGSSARGMILKSTYYYDSASSNQEKYVFYTILVVFSGGICNNGGIDFKFYSSLKSNNNNDKTEIQAGSFLNAGDFIGTINSETGLVITYVVPLLEIETKQKTTAKRAVSVPENFVQFDENLSEISLLTMCSVETLIPARFGIGQI